MRRVLAAILALVPTSAAIAQDGVDDWDFGADPARKLTLAAVSFENFGIAVRCMDGTLGVVASGLPPGRNLRTIAYRMGDAAEEDTRWVAHEAGETAFAVWPARLATEMSRGGRLSLSMRDGDRMRRIEVDLPSSPNAIARVFAACDRELAADRPSEEPAGEEFSGLAWSQVPQPRFPDRTAAATGLAALTCRTTNDGYIRGCRVESEFPEGAGFGRAATLGAHRTGRVRQINGSRTGMEGRRLNFVVQYNLSSEPPLPASPSRIDRTRSTMRPPAESD